MKKKNFKLMLGAGIVVFTIAAMSVTSFAAPAMPADDVHYNMPADAVHYNMPANAGGTTLG